MLDMFNEVHTRNIKLREIKLETKFMHYMHMAVIENLAKPLLALSCVTCRPLICSLVTTYNTDGTKWLSPWSNVLIWKLAISVIVISSSYFHSETIILKDICGITMTSRDIVMPLLQIQLEVPLGHSHYIVWSTRSSDVIKLFTSGPWMLNQLIILRLPYRNDAKIAKLEMSTLI